MRYNLIGKLLAKKGTRNEASERSEKSEKFGKFANFSRPMRPAKSEKPKDLAKCAKSKNGERCKNLDASTRSANSEQSEKSESSEPIADADPLKLKGSPTSVDPDEERSPPPQPIVVHFPQSDINLNSSDDWARHPPDLSHLFAVLGKPSDVKVSHLETLNITAENDVELENLVPSGSDEIPHLPPKTWLNNLNPSSRRAATQTPAVSPQMKHLTLSNGAKAPGADVLIRHAKELACSTEDGLRETARRKPRPGRQAPIINHYRDFWDRLELVSQYWDTSLDNYYETEDSESAPRQSSPTSPRSIKRLSAVFMGGEKIGRGTEIQHSSPEKKKRKKYKGWRKSNGAKMPESLRIELVKIFVRNIALSFNCHMAVPRRTPHIEFKTLLLPVNQSVCFWRNPEDRNQLRRGIMEGPVLSVQCRSDINFAKEQKYGPLDLAREIAGLLLLAQERHREGKKRTIPGLDKWYTTKPRWGGGPGGEFGEGDAKKEGPPRRNYAPTHAGLRPKSEEQIWREMSPGEGLWEPRTTYLAIGRDRRSPHDTVFMVSSLYHHVCILKLEIHPLYLEFVETGRTPRSDHLDRSWCKPRMSRSRWFDLLTAEGRLEAFRGIWGVMSYLMRADPMTRKPSQRKTSEVNGAMNPRRKSLIPLQAFMPQRSRSVAF